MERIRERLGAARKALGTLRELTNKSNVSAVERDAAIQRFEYTFEALWKTAQIFLSEMEGVTANSPKSAVRASWQAGLLAETDAESALRMCDARNVTVHTYNEQLAISVFRQIKEYAGLLEVWLSAMEKRLGEE